MPGSSGADVIRSIAITAEDVAVALEANRTEGRQTVLRVTPPFSARMRARLHVESENEYDDDPTPLHIAPETLLAPDAPSYPTPAETEDRLRDDPDVEYTIERHRERHVEAVADWRETIAHHFVDEIDISGPAGTHRVAVRVLG